VKNCRLKKVKMNAQGFKMHGFVLMAKGELHEFYFKEDE
jgi:hypothetical protein